MLAIASEHLNSIPSVPSPVYSDSAITIILLYLQQLILDSGRFFRTPLHYSLLTTVFPNIFHYTFVHHFLNNILELGTAAE